MNPTRDAIALDRATVRTFNGAGHLSVARTPISRAIVSDYLGREIPGFQALGLNSDRIYRLYRDAGALEKSASSFIGKPVLLRHQPCVADEHPRDITVGAIGAPVEFEGDTLFARLDIWDKEAIDLIEDDTRRNLSCGYAYRPIMESGVAPNGERYDGRMVDIEGNHIAQVEEGRVPGAMVADAALPKEFMAHQPSKPDAAGLPGEPQPKGDEMANKPLSRKAALAQGAVMAFLRPKLAADAKLNLNSVFADVTKDNFDKEKIAAAIDPLLKGKLSAEIAQDELAAFIGAFDEEIPAEEEKRAEDESEEGDKDGKKQAEDESGDDADKDKKAEDEKDDEEMVTKSAMDAAIKASTEAAAKIAQDAAMKTHREIREAERAVRPYVGELAIACDSAEGVYRAALKMLGVKGAETIHASALPTILEMQPKPGDRKAAPVKVAMDSSALDQRKAMFPNANRLN